MNRGPWLFLGLLLTISTSFWGLILAPQLQVGQMLQVDPEGLGDRYPNLRPGLAEQGAQVYRANGCAECHTQQVRPEALGSDIARGWGQRRTVARDYLYDNPVLLGSVRLGPDLSNIGVRQTNAFWHLTHFYHPKSVSPGSTMPPYRYLFEKRKIAEGQSHSPEALPLGELVEKGYEVVPGPDALALTAYMLSLKSERPLREATLPAPPTNALPADLTNSVESASTNESPSTNAGSAAP